MQLRSADQAKPSFTLEDYFVGRTRAWGMFVDRFGEVRRQFHVDIRGDIEDGRLILKEDFTYDDGERSTRTWRITPLGEGRYLGNADDVAGVAKGEVTGNCLRWSYDLDLAIGQRTWRVRLHDVMLLQDDHILLNRASMSKYGIALGEVIICFQKEAAPARNNASIGEHGERGANEQARIDNVTRSTVAA